MSIETKNNILKYSGSTISASSKAIQKPKLLYENNIAQENEISSFSIHTS